MSPKVIMLPGLFGKPVACETSGRFGDSAEWSYEESSKTITIRGTGKLEGRMRDKLGSVCAFVEHVIIEEGITCIGEQAFYWTNIVSVKLPDSIITIERYAFAYCTKLSLIEFGKGIKEIKAHAFENSKCYIKVCIPTLDVLYNLRYNGATSSPFCHSGGELYIAGKPLNSLSICSSLENKIRSFQFYGNDCLQSLYLRDGVNSIEEGAFHNCKHLSELSIGDCVTSIGTDAFSGCSSLESVTIPGTVVRVYGSAFSNCLSLSHLRLSDGIERIGAFAFLNCIQLLEIKIPASVTNIGSCAFGYDKKAGNLECVKVPNVVIIGNIGTAAEKYAKENGFQFRDINSYLRKETNKIAPSLRTRIEVMLRVNSGVTVGSVVDKLSQTYKRSEVCEAVCDYLKDQYLV